MFLKKIQTLLKANWSFCFFAILLVTGVTSLGYSNQKAVLVIELDNDTINPVTATYITNSIDEAQAQDAECLIIKLDTPGGLLESTRTIVKKMLTSKVPIVVYISPSGSRAGSAGVFITYASHIAAMAPSTNIGAAHPVSIGGGSEKAPKTDKNWKELKGLVESLKEDIASSKATDDGVDEIKEESLKAAEELTKTSEAVKKVIEDEAPDQTPMESKILNDTVAFIKAIAQERGRNVEWAIKSVKNSESITANEALAQNVVELIADSETDLLNQLDGRTVIIDNVEIVLHTKNAFIERKDMDFRERLFNVLANPNIAYFLMIFGFYGLLFEITHPGIGVPGILGTIFLILAFYSMQTLPTNYAGLALLLLGISLLIAEGFVPGFGLLTLGGVTCMILGSFLLFDSVDPIMRVSKQVIFSFTLTTAAISLFLIQSVIRAHRTKVKGGEKGLIGEIAEVKKEICAGSEGKVFVHGELWTAKSNEPLVVGAEVEVVAIKHLILTVKSKP